MAVNSKDQVHIFTRGEHPVIVFDSEGNCLRSWGEDDNFVNPHGIAAAPDDSIVCVDNADHTVRVYTPEGKLRLTLGDAGKPTAAMSGDPFNQPTHAVVDPNDGAIYVADGYANARVHKYDNDGRHLFSWGESGTAPGQFNVVHNIAVDNDGWVYIGDRENHRIQVFSSNGVYETQWVNLARTAGVFIDLRGDQNVYLGRAMDRYRVQRGGRTARAACQHPGQERENAGPPGRGAPGRHRWALLRAARDIRRFQGRYLRSRGIQLRVRRQARPASFGPAHHAQAHQADVRPPRLYREDVVLRSKNVDSWMAELDPSVRQIAQAVRGLIEDTSPGLTESVKWSQPVYSGHSNVLYIGATDSYVKLGFFRGGYLIGAAHELDGEGKSMRHVKIRAPEDLDVARLGRLDT